MGTSFVKPAGDCFPCMGPSLLSALFLPSTASSAVVVGFVSVRVCGEGGPAVRSSAPRTGGCPFSRSSTSVAPAQSVSVAPTVVSSVSLCSCAVSMGGVSGPAHEAALRNFNCGRRRLPFLDAPVSSVGDRGRFRFPACFLDTHDASPLGWSSASSHGR